MKKICGDEIKCTDCSITDIRILTIDHINGGGNKHRKEIGATSSQTVYSYIKKLTSINNFAVRCYNHNSGKENETN